MTQDTRQINFDPNKDKLERCRCGPDKVFYNLQCINIFLIFNTFTANKILRMIVGIHHTISNTSTKGMQLEIVA